MVSSTYNQQPDFSSHVVRKWDKLVNNQDYNKFEVKIRFVQSRLKAYAIECFLFPQNVMI
jgi:hypothetical protein